MFKIITGIAFGYFLYTDNGKKQLNELGKYVTDSLKLSIKEVNSLFKNKEVDNGTNSEISSEKNNGRIERS